MKDVNGPLRRPWAPVWGLKLMRRGLSLDQAKNALAGSQVRRRLRARDDWTPPPPAPPRRIWIQQANLPKVTLEQIDLTDCVWVEDSTEAGNEPGQRALPVEELIEHAASIYGGADNLTVNTTTRPIVNYAESFEFGNDFSADPVAGILTVNDNTVEQIQFFVYGTQGNDTKEHMMRLLIRVTDAPSINGDYVVALFDVATDKTDERLFSGTITRRLPVGTKLQLCMNASADMGLFTILSCSFALG